VTEEWKKGRYNRTRGSRDGTKKQELRRRRRGTGRRNRE